MKPIETGCLALVVNANSDKNMIGKVMRVTARAEDKDHFFEGQPAWRLDKPIPNLACERWLVRIDGGEDEFVFAEQGMEVPAYEEFEDMEMEIVSEGEVQ